MNSPALETLTRIDMGLSYLAGDYEVIRAKDEYIVQLEKQNAQLLESARRLVAMREADFERTRK